MEELFKKKIKIKKPNTALSILPDKKVEEKSKEDIEHECELKRLDFDEAKLKSDIFFENNKKYYVKIKNLKDNLDRANLSEKVKLQKTIDKLREEQDELNKEHDLLHHDVLRLGKELSLLHVHRRKAVLKSKNER